MGSAPCCIRQEAGPLSDIARSPTVTNNYYGPRDGENRLRFLLSRKRHFQLLAKLFGGGFDLIQLGPMSKV